MVEDADHRRRDAVGGRGLLARRLARLDQRDVGGRLRDAVEPEALVEDAERLAARPAVELLELGAQARDGAVLEQLVCGEGAAQRGSVLERLQLPVGRSVLDAERAPQRLERRAAAHEPVVHDVLGQERVRLADVRVDAVADDAARRRPSTSCTHVHGTGQSSTGGGPRRAGSSARGGCRALNRLKASAPLRSKAEPPGNGVAQQLREVVVADALAVVALEAECTPSRAAGRWRGRRCAPRRRSTAARRRSARRWPTGRPTARRSRPTGRSRS